MATTDRKVGKDQYFEIDGTQITGLREVTISPTIDTVDSTAGSENSKSYIGTLRDATITLRYVYEGGTPDQSHIINLKPDGTLRSWQYGPEGSATDLPVDAGSALVTSHEKTASYDGLIERTTSLQVSGDLVRESETDVW